GLQRDARAGGETLVFGIAASLTHSLAAAVVEGRRIARLTDLLDRCKGRLSILFFTNYGAA
ncbi:hypothetical protein V9073_10635, partial [Streptococcus agalactiae]|uniref:hypothetical protein n=1 Tax=Streptococcus agalactiae TaxID=1311 RepID=UPI0030105E85